MRFAKIRTKKALIMLAVVVAAGIVAIMPMLVTTAVETETGYKYTPAPGVVGSMQDKLEAEAKAQLSAKVLLDCLGGGVNRNTSWDDTKSAKKWFDRFGNDMDIDTGYWYEKEVTGSYSDGRIWCSETGGADVIATAAKYLGTNKNGILCNGSAAGIAKNKDGYDCGSSSGKYTRNGNNGGDGLTKIPSSSSAYKQQGWYKHVKSVYDTMKNKEGWDTELDNIGTFGGTVGYYLYRTEISAKCGGVVETYDTKPSDMTMVLTDVTQDKEQAGKIVYKKYGQNSSFTHEFVSRSDVLTCKGMIARANENEIFSLYRDKLLKVLNRACRDDIESRKALVEQRGDTIEEEVLQAYEAAVNDTSVYPDGMFLTGDETNGWDCADIGDWSGGLQDDPTEEEEEVTERGKECMDNAGALGWIACSLANGLSNAIQGLYEKWIVPYLRVEASMFTTEGSANNVFMAWQIFQTFADLAFIGILIFIIFSQVTGYGIDNYGIKRTLPKLIVGAILINTSFVISAISVDLSNILGIGIGNLFKGLTKDIAIDSISVTDSSASGGAGIVGVAAGGAAATAAGIGALSLVSLISSAAASGPMLFYGGIALLIPVLMTLLSVFLAVLFFFILLSLRQAMIVILVVISPVAFACYMLENTKPLFNKWFKVFKGLLLAYPIASALVYGGQSVGQLLISAEAGLSGAGSGTVSVQMMLAAAVMSVAPIFLVPNAIKGSMAGLDKITNKMAGAVGGRAKNFGNKARSNFEGSSFYQRAADSAQAARNDKMMDKVRKRQRKLEGKGEMSARERREYARNAAKLSADSARITSEYSEGYKDKTQDQIIGEFGGEFSSFTNKQGEFDVEKVAAALGSISDADQRHAAYAKLVENDKFKKAMSTAANREKIASVLSSKQGDLAGAAAAKNLLKWDGKDGDALESGASGKAFREKLQDLGTGAMANADKDTFKIPGIGDVLSDDQIKAGIGSGYSGSTAKSFNDMLSGLADDGRREKIAQTLKDDQFGGLSMATIGALTGVQTLDSNGEAKKISDFSDSELQQIRSKFDANTLASLGSDSGDTIRAKMDPTVLAVLGVQRVKGPQQVIVVDHNNGGGGGNGGSAGGPSGPSGGNPFNGQSGTT